VTTRNHLSMLFTASAAERGKYRMARVLLPPNGALRRIGVIADGERSGRQIRLILQRSRRLCVRLVAGASPCSRRREAGDSDWPNINDDEAVNNEKLPPASRA
jgi:hypothetical protein